MGVSNASLRVAGGGLVKRALSTSKEKSMNLVKQIRAFVRNESGAALVEYSLLIGLITVAVVITIGLVGTWVAAQWTALNAAVS